MRRSPSPKPPTSGFSLIEVVIALGVVAFVIPAIMGMFAIFSTSSAGAMNRGEAASVVKAVQVYLNGKVKDQGTSAKVPFETAYQWVYEASESSARAKVLYAYKTAATQADYLVSQRKPAGSVEGKFLGVKIPHAREQAPPADVLVSDSTSYGKSYLPLASVDLRAIGPWAGPDAFQFRGFLSRDHLQMKRTNAFTLVELLVALTVAILLVVTVASIVSSGTNLSSLILGRLSTQQDAKVALDFLERDFEALTPAELGRTTLTILPETVTGPEWIEPVVLLDNDADRPGTRRSKAEFARSPIACFTATR